MASRHAVAGLARQALTASSPVPRRASAAATAIARSPSAVAGPSRLASSSAARKQASVEASDAGAGAGAGAEASASAAVSAHALADGNGNSNEVPLAHSQPSVMEPAKTHARTHGHHVATLHLRSYGLPVQKANLVFFADFAVRVGYALGIPLSRPAALPMSTSLWTVLRSPFVHKKSQENFTRRTHRRVIKAWDADPQVIERWLHFLRIHAMPGVGMRVEQFRHLPLGVGSEMLAASTAALRSVPTQGPVDREKDAASDTPTLRASEADSEAVARLADQIVREELATHEAEASADATETDARAVEADAKQAADELKEQGPTVGAGDKSSQ